MGTECKVTESPDPPTHAHPNPREVRQSGRAGQGTRQASVQHPSPNNKTQIHTEIKRVWVQSPVFCSFCSCPSCAVSVARAAALSLGEHGSLAQTMGGGALGGSCPPVPPSPRRGGSQQLSTQRRLHKRARTKDHGYCTPSPALLLAIPAAAAADAAPLGAAQHLDYGPARPTAGGRLRRRPPLPPVVPAATVVYTPATLPARRRL